MEKLIEEKLEKYKLVLGETQLRILAYDFEEMYRTGSIAGVDRAIKAISGDKK